MNSARRVKTKRCSTCSLTLTGGGDAGSAHADAERWRGPCPRGSAAKITLHGRLDILSVNETKRKGNGEDIKHGSFETYCYGVDQNQRGYYGFAFVLSERLSEYLYAYECVNTKLLWLQAKIGFTRIFILGLYAPDILKSLEKRDARDRDEASCKRRSSKM
ncbi:hypothetical protein EVAR_48632_1 [Eumeta japonica]|uniref:Uncharacterized protein n=1 Tax=Eumeta variegata TaxID=151549 RepID=A0A4C1XSG0_EUMVA|nr:hypothetical protein EVAR_48632_1 [Eumeta japonica]